MCNCGQFSWRLISKRWLRYLNSAEVRQQVHHSEGGLQKTLLLCNCQQKLVYNMEPYIILYLTIRQKVGSNLRNRYRRCWLSLAGFQHTRRISSIAVSSDMVLYNSIISYSFRLSFICTAEVRNQNEQNIYEYDYWLSLIRQLSELRSGEKGPKSLKGLKEEPWKRVKSLLLRNTLSLKLELQENVRQRSRSFRFLHCDKKNSE